VSTRLILVHRNFLASLVI